MSSHFYLSDHHELLAEGKALLSGQEAQHIIRVLRKKIGDEVLLFDGSGREYRSIIKEIRKNEILFSILEVEEKSNAPDLDLTMAVALPKGDRQKWLIEKLTELGVRRFIPIRAERSDVKIDDDVLDRLRRQVIEASKQSGSLRLMEIFPEMSRREIAESFPFDSEGSEEGSLAVFSHPLSDGSFGQISFANLIENSKTKSTRLREVLAVVGPAGGWTEQEVQAAAEDHWPILDLGKQIYRAETAAVVLAALFLHLE
ncbi:MAG: RsmE family RNA methyltransferase [Planctomycetia bacterium]|nr:RsmE family RNA methyltransferase [Planctomycetia bacterium]